MPTNIVWLVILSAPNMMVYPAENAKVARLEDGRVFFRAWNKLEDIASGYLGANDTAFVSKDNPNDHNWKD